MFRWVSADGRGMWRRLYGLGSFVVAMAMVTSACGGVDDAGVDAAQPQADTTVVVDEPGPEATTGATSDEEPEALALREDDSGADEAPGTTAPVEPQADAATSSAAALPPIAELDAGLAEFADCLNDNGVEVAPFTLQDMISKAAGMPLVESRAEMFGFFLDTDGSDPTFQAAVEACNPIVDAIPGLGAFLPQT